MGYRSGSGTTRGMHVGLGVLLVAVLIGVVVYAPSGGDPAVPPDPGPASLDVIPTSDDPERVVAAWLDGTATRRVLDSPGYARELVRDLVVPAAQDRMLAEFTRGAAALDTDEAAPLVTRSLPFGFREVQRDERAATIETEQLIVQSLPTDPPVAALARSRVQLDHLDGWRIASVRVDAVPLAEASHARLSAIDSRFTEYRHVP